MLPSMAAIWISHLRGLTGSALVQFLMIFGAYSEAPGAACRTVWCPYSYIHSSTHSLCEGVGVPEPGQGPENTKVMNRLSLPFRRPQAGKQTTEGLSNMSGCQGRLPEATNRSHQSQTKIQLLVRTRQDKTCDYQSTRLFFPPCQNT